MRGIGARIVGLLVLSMIGTLASGCMVKVRKMRQIGVTPDGNAILEFYEVEQSIFSPTKTAPERNHAVAIRAREGGEYGVLQVGRDLRVPFRWEVTAGRFDPDLPEVGPGFFCTELDERGSDPLVFFSLCAQPVSGGLNAFAARNGDNDLGQVFFPDVHALDLAIETDGTDMIFQARPRGGSVWTEVARIAYTGQAAPLFPSVGAVNIAAGSAAVFDDARVRFNGPLPEGTSPERVLVRAIWDALDPLIDAGHRLDSGEEQGGGLAPDLDGSLPLLDDAVAAAEALPEGAARKSALKSVGAIRKKVLAALAKIDGARPDAAIQKDIGRAVLEGMEAAARLDPYFE